MPNLSPLLFLPRGGRAGQKGWIVIIRRLLKIFASVVAGLGLLVGGGWFVLQLPAAPEVPNQEQLVFSNVTVINPGRTRQAGQTLTSEGGQIISISATSSDSPTSEASDRFSGAYVLPGLIDMHVHHTAIDWELYGLLFLTHGVTTVRDTGYANTTVLNKRQQLQHGEYAGPRLFACGPILDGDPPSVAWFRTVHTPTEARTVVDEIAKAGVDCVKSYWGLSAETLAAIREASTQHELPVVGHIPFAVPFERAHVSDVQHLTGVPVTSNHVAITTTELTAWYVAFIAAWREVDAARVDFIVQTSAQQGLAHTPTLVVNAGVAQLRDYPKLLDDPASHLLPRWYREVFWQPPAAFDATFYEHLDVALPKMKEVVSQLHKAGVRIHVGTDSPNPFVVPGAGFHQELRLLVEAGLTPEEVWLAATRWAGESLGVPKLGTLGEGAPADFLLFREDPTRDLAALSTLEAVVAQGRLYPKPVLDAAFTRHRDHFTGWLYDRLTIALMSGIRWITSTLNLPQSASVPMSETRSAKPHSILPRYTQPVLRRQNLRPV